MYKVDSATAKAIRDLKIMCIDVDRRKTFKQYQYDHFKLVSTGKSRIVLQAIVNSTSVSCNNGIGEWLLSTSFDLDKLNRLFPFSFI